jgi:Fe-S cluster assembly protein SufB
MPATFHNVTRYYGNNCGAHTFPYRVKSISKIEHEAQQVKLAKTKFSIVTNVESLPKKAIALIVNGFSKDVLNKLPMEFAVEAQKLLEIL